MMRLSLIFKKKKIFSNFLFFENNAHSFQITVSCLLNSATHPFNLIFQNSLAECAFITKSKRANIVPIHKKNYKQIVSNNQPAFLLPICSNIFEKLIFNEIFSFLRINIYYLNISRVFARVIHVFIN